MLETLEPRRLCAQLIVSYTADINPFPNEPVPFIINASLDARVVLSNTVFTAELARFTFDARPINPQPLNIETHVAETVRFKLRGNQDIGDLDALVVRWRSTGESDGGFKISGAFSAELVGVEYKGPQ